MLLRAICYKLALWENQSDAKWRQYNGVPKSKAYSCGVCSLTVDANSAMCVQCGKSINSRCAGVKRVT